MAPGANFMLFERSEWIEIWFLEYDNRFLQEMQDILGKVRVIRLVHRLVD